jgi:hypothetical protein
VQLLNGSDGDNESTRSKGGGKYEENHVVGNLDRIIRKPIYSRARDPTPAERQRNKGFLHLLSDSGTRASCIC